MGSFLLVNLSVLFHCLKITIFSSLELVVCMWVFFYLCITRNHSIPSLVSCIIMHAQVLNLLMYVRNYTELLNVLSSFPKFALKASVLGKTSSRQSSPYVIISHWTKQKVPIYVPYTAKNKIFLYDFRDWFVMLMPWTKQVGVVALRT